MDYDFPDYDYPDFGFDENGDWDAMQCSAGDYNTWEENQVWRDSIRDAEEGCDEPFDDDLWDDNHDWFGGLSDTYDDY
jgi:hypothetical protein